jgi:hypothetical protein
MPEEVPSSNHISTLRTKKRVFEGCQDEKMWWLESTTQGLPPASTAMRTAPPGSEVQPLPFQRQMP